MNTCPQRICRGVGLGSWKPQVNLKHYIVCFAGTDYGYCSLETLNAGKIIVISLVSHDDDPKSAIKLLSWVQTSQKNL